MTNPEFYQMFKEQAELVRKYLDELRELKGIYHPVRTEMNPETGVIDVYIKQMLPVKHITFDVVITKRNN
jgi:hypothetical protein